MRLTLLERFESKYMPVPFSGCWIWIGATFPSGYGHIWNEAGERAAHRLSYILNKGLIPEGMCVLHRCDTPLCVNPEHLFIGTKADNNEDKKSKGRSVALRGERNGRSKLTVQQITEIRDDKRSYPKIAAEYPVGRCMIGLIKRRLNWV